MPTVTIFTDEDGVIRVNNETGWWIHVEGLVFISPPSGVFELNTTTPPSPGGARGPFEVRNHTNAELRVRGHHVRPNC